MREVQFLGHVVRANGTKVDPTKIKAIKCGLIRRILYRFRVFWILLDIVGDLSNIFLIIAGPLTKLMRKMKPFVCTDDHEQLFQILKNLLCDTPILSRHKGNKDFLEYNDASYYSLGCVLMQRGKMISYVSQQVKHSEVN